MVKFIEVTVISPPNCPVHPFPAEADLGPKDSIEVHSPVTGGDLLLAAAPDRSHRGRPRELTLACWLQPAVSPLRQLLRPVRTAAEEEAGGATRP